MTRLVLELSVDHGDAARIAVILGLPRSPRVRPSPLHIVWHDTTGADLARRGLSLIERREGRQSVMRLERSAAERTDPEWHPAEPVRLIAEAEDLDALRLASREPFPTALARITAFEGSIRVFEMADGPEAATLTVITGTLRAVAGERHTGRIWIDGDSAFVTRRVHLLSDVLKVAVPATSFAAEAFAVAQMDAPAPRRGPPEPPADLSPAEALDFIAACLTRTILHHAPGACAAADPEPVHQMRVAIRRLRSALQLWVKIRHHPDLPALKSDIKALGHLLGAARDWDVFIGGVVTSVLAALPGDASIRQLATLAKTRREAAYAELRAYLEGPAFRHLGLKLALLPMTSASEPASSGLTDPNSGNEASPAPEAAPADPPDLHTFAARALTKRRKRVRAAGRSIRELPAAELHAVRLDAKRLRYVAEFFAPLFPAHETRKFIRRLGALQEQLGYLNDGASVEALLAQLGQTRKLAGGVVRGFVAAGSVQAREEIDAIWRKFRRQDAFWR